MPATSLRIMHVLGTLPGYGAENFVIGLLPELAALGMEVAAMSVYPSAFSTASPAPPGVRVFDVARAGRYEAGFFFRMLSQMKLWRPTIVHTHMHTGKYWGRLAAIVAGVRYIVHTEHDPELRTGLLGRATHRLLNLRTAALIAVSEFQRDAIARIEKAPKTKIIVIPNGIVYRAADAHGRAHGRAALQARDDEFAILHIGRLMARKNQALALRALAALQPELRARTRLYIVGSSSGVAGWDETKLRELSQQLRLSDRVAFLGYRSDVRELLAGADLLLMTSLSEALPITLIEAMVAGVPIATTPWGGASEMLQGGRLGWIADDWSVESVAALVERAADDRVNTSAHVSAARREAQTLYDVRASARGHAELYHALINGLR